MMATDIKREITVNIKKGSAMMPNWNSNEVINIRFMKYSQTGPNRIKLLGTYLGT